MFEYAERCGRCATVFHSSGLENVCLPCRTVDKTAATLPVAPAAPYTDAPPSAHLLAAKDAEIARLSRELEVARARSLETTEKHIDCFKKHVDARGMLIEALPVLADHARDPDVAKLCREIRDFLEPAPPAAKKPSVADTVLAHAFGNVGAVLGDHSGWRVYRQFADGTMRRIE